MTTSLEVHSWVDIVRNELQSQEALHSLGHIVNYIQKLERKAKAKEANGEGR